ncbi:zinc ribbon domain-containing protein [Lactiplantibacillus daowaiensis]|uniref:Zinc-ribbon domain-containing protein n=1 Tax=Lactiplantibacillus daowaiensis TaxID=2559918 RepID=A0ABW1RWW9_9LACO|nr:zinc ribbon domain-containing protein [Lactiplantibacillus daowaiensis]
MFCSNCGKKVPAETKFCPHCGADLRGQSVAQPTPQPAATASSTGTAAKAQVTNWWGQVQTWYQSLTRPWLVWLVAVIVVVVIGGGVYRHNSFRATAERYPSWILTTKDGLTGSGSAAYGRISFKSNGRVYTNQDDDASSLTDALSARIEDTGTWHGDHKTVTTNLNTTDSSSSSKMVFTRQGKFSKAINGTKYRGYQVRVDITESGSHESLNMYLLHN